MPKYRILVVDDEEDILELVQYNLEKEGYTVTCSSNGEDAFSNAKANLPDLVLLDLMLPGMDGLSVCRLLKTNLSTSQIPVIMLTAKGEESDVVTGLELGADDYITKPFSPKVLIARIRTVFRRKMMTTDETAVIRMHDLTIDPNRHEVLVNNKAVELTFTEFGILKMLANRPGIVFTRYQIVDSVKGNEAPVTDRSVDVQIVSLRRKLGSAGKHIETVRGIGYKFRE